MDESKIWIIPKKERLARFAKTMRLPTRIAILHLRLNSMSVSSEIFAKCSRQPGIHFRKCMVTEALRRRIATA